MGITTLFRNNNGVDHMPSNRLHYDDYDHDEHYSSTVKRLGGQ